MKLWLNSCKPHEQMFDSSSTGLNQLRCPTQLAVPRSRSLIMYIEKMCSCKLSERKACCTGPFPLCTTLASHHGLTIKHAFFTPICHLQFSSLIVWGKVSVSSVFRNLHSIHSLAGRSIDRIEYGTFCFLGMLLQA